MKYFTKSVFKEALACPARMNYCNRAEYANQDISNEFLESLAEGGFQVGELAKIYYDVPKENDLNGTNAEIAAKTRELLDQENVTIAEAGFAFENCFCRVDLLRKAGNEIELVEVKSKSWGGKGDVFLSSRKGGDLPAGSVRTAIRDYVYDVAFQKYVVTHALAQMFPGRSFHVRAIRRQLLARNDQPDRDELVAFIESVTHMTGDEAKAAGIKGDPPSPPRDMVDLWDMVKRFYYDPYMKGSNSIKVVLPSVLNGSAFLREKYSRPIYGSEIESMNFTAETAKSWITEKDGQVVNPYKLLDEIATFFPEDVQGTVRRAEASTEEVEGEVEGQINNGGAALWAYGLLQFCKEKSETKAAIVEALYRYCELDTLAMVFIWEYFNAEVQGGAEMR